MLQNASFKVEYHSYNYVDSSASIRVDLCIFSLVVNVGFRLYPGDLVGITR